MVPNPMGRALQHTTHGTGSGLAGALVKPQPPPLPCVVPEAAPPGTVRWASRKQARRPKAERNGFETPVPEGGPSEESNLAASQHCWRRATKPGCDIQSESAGGQAVARVESMPRERRASPSAHGSSRDRADGDGAGCSDGGSGGRNALRLALELKLALRTVFA